MAGTVAQPSSTPDAKPPADLSGASWDALISQAVKGLRSDDEIISQLKESARAIRDVEKSVANISLPDPPPTPELPPPPQPRFTSPMEEFGSIASTLGIFASLLTRRPLTSALNASAAAMQSIRQGDYTAYQTAMDQWKNQSDYAIKVADMQNQRYQQILDNTKFTIDQKTNLINMEAAANNDLVAASKMRSDGIDGVANLLMNRTRLQIALSRAAGGVPKWSVQNEAYLGYRQQAMDAWQTANPGKTPTAGDLAKIDTSAYEKFRASSGSGSATTARQARAVNTADDLVAKIQKNLDEPGTLGLGVAGPGGEIGYLTETWETLFPSKKKVALPVTTFRSNLAKLRAMLPSVLTGQGRSSADVRALIEEIAPGLEWDATVAKTKDALQTLSDTMVDVGGKAATPPGAGVPDPSTAPYAVQLQDGSNAYSDDGQTWYDENGDPVDTGQ